MSSDERIKAEPCAGTFTGCLVNGDAVENARESKIKSRALIVSIVLQTAGLAALVIAPLLAKPAVLSERMAVPIPPYHRVSTQRRVDATPPGQQQIQRCIWCGLQNSQRPISLHDDSRINAETTDPRAGIDISGVENAPGPLNSIGTHRDPPPPPHTARVAVGHIDPALLTQRVEPVFPVLARQLHKSGRVELHAVIGIDGAIESLQVVSGDPLFVNSAREAVSQWRYKPTYLNGKPVEVDTFITVIYTLQQ